MLKGKKVFWVTVFLLVGAAISAVELTLNRWPLMPISMSHKLACYAAAGILVAVIWAILFRTQIEKLRVSLFAMLVLILMEAVLLVAIRIAHPIWAM